LVDPNAASFRRHLRIANRRHATNRNSVFSIASAVSGTIRDRVDPTARGRKRITLVGRLAGSSVQRRAPGPAGRLLRHLDLYLIRVPATVFSATGALAELAISPFAWGDGGVRPLYATPPTSHQPDADVSRHPGKPIQARNTTSTPRGRPTPTATITDYKVGQSTAAEAMRSTPSRRPRAGPAPRRTFSVWPADAPTQTASRRAYPERSPSPTRASHDLLTASPVANSRPAARSSPARPPIPTRRPPTPQLRRQR